MKKLKKSKYVQPIKKEEPSRLKSLMPLIIVALLAVAIILGVTLITAGDNKSFTSSTSTKGTQSNESTQSADSNLIKADVEATSCYADIEIENYGTITVYLDAQSAPMTVNNFVSLAKSGFYDGLTFHRIIEGFMMQGGDPLGNGTGGSDTTITGEFVDNGYANYLSHTRGTISMARSTAFNSASSQFFIMHEDAPHLDGAYAAFGQVTSGIEVVDAICEATPVQDMNGTVSAANQPRIKEIRIVE